MFMAKFPFSASQHEDVSAFQRKLGQNFLIQTKNYVYARTSFSAAAEVQVHGNSVEISWKFQMFFMEGFTEIQHNFLQI